METENEEGIMGKYFQTTITDPLEQLDDVLRYLRTSAQGSSKTIQDIKANVSATITKAGVEETLLWYILGKICDDGFAKKHDNHNPVRYSITYDGIYFGGYVKQAQKENSERNRIRNLETRTLWLTFLIALGTLIAGVYYLTEIFSK